MILSKPLNHSNGYHRVKANWWLSLRGYWNLDLGIPRLTPSHPDCIHHTVFNGIYFLITHCRNAMQRSSDVWWSLMESVLENNKRCTCPISTKMGTYFVHSDVSSRSLSRSWQILSGQISTSCSFCCIFMHSFFISSSFVWCNVLLDINHFVS